MTHETNPEAPKTQGRAVVAIWLMLAGAAIYQVTSVGVFMFDPTETDYAFTQTHRELNNEEFAKPFYLKHNCSTCYIVAAHLAGAGVENIYDKKHYRDAEVGTPVHETIGETFHIDQYQYPPPFLLGPYAAYKTGFDFFEIRSLWFVISIATIALTSIALAVWVGGWGFNPLWFLLPAILVAPYTIATLQIGNAHVFMVLISILAMLLFEKKRHALGGMLLAYATLSKFFPGLLVVYLVFRKKWAPAVWTVAACFLLCGASLAVFGMSPYQAFINHQLPAIASGQAFWFAFEKPHAMLANSSIMGLFFKLNELGIASDWDPKSTAKLASWVYTLFAIGLAALAGRKHAHLDKSSIRASAGTRLIMVRAWVALIVLAQLRSPFLPAGYGNITVIILLALLVPIESLSLPRLVVIALVMSLFALPFPLAWGPVNTSFDFVLTSAATIIALLLATIVALRRPALAAAPLSETGLNETPGTPQV